MMIRPAVPTAFVLALAACSAPAPAPDRNTARTSAATALSATTAPARPPAGASLDRADKTYVGAGGLVHARYAAPLVPGDDFAGRSLMTAGWRLMWDGKPAGPGTGVVSFAESARPADGVGQVTEMVRIGMSRDADVVATCGTAGMEGARRLPNRMLGGHRWTVWQGSDAGMSQQVDATDYRTVVDGVCYAIDRVSYAVKALDAKPGLPTQEAAAARVDAVLASIRVGE